MTDATGLITGDHARIRPPPAVPGKFAHDRRPAARQGPGTASGLAGAGETEASRDGGPWPGQLRELQRAAGSRDLKNAI
jgi:hypothetical protein